MKTIKQIADEIGVSKQAVYKKIKQEPLSTSLQELTTTVDGKLTVLVDGEKLIKSAFSMEIPSTVSTNQVDDIVNRFTASLQGQIATLTEQNQDLRNQLNDERTHSREQADKLSDLAAQLAELTRNNQLLLGAEQSRTNPALLASDDRQPHPDEEQQKKKGLFGWFKK